MVVKRITRYFKGILDFKLCFKGKDIALRGFCNVDWLRDANDRRSTMGTFFCLRWAHFVEMQETTNHCIVYDGSEDNRSTSFMIVHYLI